MNKKKAYIQPQADVVALKGDALMDGEWWSVGVDPGEEIEDDDIGAKQGTFFDKDGAWGGKSKNLWED